MSRLSEVVLVEDVNFDCALFDAKMSSPLQRKYGTGGTLNPINKIEGVCACVWGDGGGRIKSE